MKKPFLVWMTAVILILAGSAAWADFINGGFEDGTFTGWTKNGGAFNNSPSDGTYHYTGDPGKSVIVSPGYDYYSNNQLPVVAYGNYSARVNNYDNNNHFSTLSQTQVWNDNHIYFAWAALLEEPGNNVVHSNAQAPNFSINLKDDTKSATLYSVSFSVYNPPPGVIWKTGRKGGAQDSNSTWRFTDWVIVDLDTSAYKGDSLTLTVLAADCSLGGHGGYAYVDYFSPIQPPPPPPSVPLPPSVWLFGSGLLGLSGWRRFRKN